MDACVDLNNLREITGQDRDLEAELFAEFIDTSSNLILALEQQQDDGSHEVWSKSAHALKGISYNLGAQRLGLLSQEAQEIAASDAPGKAIIFASLRDEQIKVVAFLNAELA